jgi:hypothetical protein
MGPSQPPLDAYRRAVYRVDAPAGSFDLRIGERSERLDALLVEHGVRVWGLVTAVNPGSVRRTDEDNRARTARLCARIEELGRRWLPTRGLDPDGAWPDEPGFLVLGADARETVALGRAFEQAAVVVGGAGGPAELRVVAPGEAP